MRYQVIIVLFAILALISGCGTPPSETTPVSTTTSQTQSAPPSTTQNGDIPSSTPEEELEPGVLLPGQLDASMLNQIVKVRGEIVQVFQDPGGQGGYYFNVSGGGGVVGLRIEDETWNSLTDIEKAGYQQGNVVTFEGMLVQHEDELVVVLVIMPPPSEPAEARIATAIVIPSDISKIDYPGFYNNPSVVQDYIVENACCAIERDEITYPAEYLGDFAFPVVTGAPLPSSIQRLVGLKDVWIPEPNLNEGCVSSGFEAMREAYEKTLPRVKALNADGITFSNYVHITDYQNAVIAGPENAAMPEDDLRFAAGKAREQGLDMVLYLNLALADEVDSLEVLDEDWLAALIRNWGVFVLNQAGLAEETGIGAIMLNHFDCQFGIAGYEDVFQTEMLALLQQVRGVYSGKVLLMIEPLWGAELGKLDRLLNDVDGFLFTPVTNILENADDKTVSVDNLKSLYLNHLEEIGRDFGMYGKPFYLRVLIQSTRVFLEEGWHEEMFCIQHGDDPCYQNSLEVDFSVQAIAYEAMMEAISEASGNYFEIAAVDAYGYWYTDVILPNISHPQIGQSIRNKPAECIVRRWFERLF